MKKSKIDKNNLEIVPKDNMLFPDKSEIEKFSREVMEHLDDLSFEAKQAIIRESTDLITVGGGSLQAYGSINLSKIYVVLCTENRNRRATQRREKHIV